MSTHKKIAVYPGSFNPVHPGHIDIMRQAAQIFDEVHVLVACNPNKSYAVSLEKRCEFIDRLLGCRVLDWSNRIIIVPTSGSLADYCKSNGINTVIRGIRNGTDLEYEKSQELYNRLLMPKDSELNYVYFTIPGDYEMFSSTSIRQFILYSNTEQLANLYFFGGCRNVAEVIEDIHKAYGGI